MSGICGWNLLAEYPQQQNEGVLTIGVSFSHQVLDRRPYPFAITIRFGEVRRPLVDARVYEDSFKRLITAEKAPAQKHVRKTLV